MEVKYRIIDVDSVQHSITVRYYTDLLTEDSLATSFNIDGTIQRDSNGYPLRCQTDYHINIWKTTPPPTENEIREIANSSAPYDWFKLKHDILDPNVDTSLSQIHSLIGKEFTAIRPVAPNPVVEISANTSDLNDDDIHKLINNIINSSDNT